jgi:hypothetical protein
MHPGVHVRAPTPRPSPLAANAACGAHVKPRQTHHNPPAPTLFTPASFLVPPSPHTHVENALPVVGAQLAVLLAQQEPDG